MTFKKLILVAKCVVMINKRLFYTVKSTWKLELILLTGEQRSCFYSPLVWCCCYLLEGTVSGSDSNNISRKLFSYLYISRFLFFQLFYLTSTLFTEWKFCKKYPAQNGGKHQQLVISLN